MALAFGSQKSTLREKVMADPYHYQHRAKKINAILKTEFLDKGIPIEPLPPVDAVAHAAYGVGGVLWVALLFALTELTTDRNPPFSQCLLLMFVSFVISAGCVAAFLIWWDRTINTSDPPAVAEITQDKKEQ
jgi:hypothetical protein